MGVADGRFWVRTLQGSDAPPMDFTGAPTAARWTQVGKAAFFVVATLTDVESSALSWCIENAPDDVIFTGSGDVRFKTPDGGVVEVHNPLRSQALDFGVPSVATLRRSSNKQFKFDATLVPNRGMTHFLTKSDVDGKWRIVYNPVHSSSVRDYYAHTIASGHSTGMQWRVADGEVGQTEAINMRRAINNYCALHVQTDSSVDASKKSYADPSCSLVRSPETCRNGAFFDENLVVHEEAEDEDLRKALEHLSDGNPPACVCGGRPRTWWASNLRPDASFLNDFWGVNVTGACARDLQINVCSIRNTAKKLTINGASMTANCGPLSDQAEEGDIILFSGKRPEEACLQCLMGAKYQHVAILVHEIMQFNPVGLFSHFGHSANCSCHGCDGGCDGGRTVARLQQSAGYLAAYKPCDLDLGTQRDFVRTLPLDLHFF